jgi:hypothetical protein
MGRAGGIIISFHKVAGVSRMMMEVTSRLLISHTRSICELVLTTIVSSYHLYLLCFDSIVLLLLLVKFFLF